MENVMKNDNKMLQAGIRLKTLRKQAHLTQEKLTELIENLPENKGKNRARNHISNIENGKESISPEYAHLLSKVLNVRPEFFLLETDYVTAQERISAICHNTIDKLELCTLLIEKMGYKIITMEEKEDGSESSMHRDYKKITILSDDSAEDILRKTENALPIRYYILQSPNGSKTTIEQDEFYRILHNILDYAKFEIEKQFHKFDNHFMK